MTADDRIALVVIDMQNSYFEFPELAALREGLVARINELVRAAREADAPVILVRTEHQRDRSTWTLNMLADDQGFAFPGTEQAEYLPELDTAGGIDVTKTRDDAFHDTRLDEVLAEHEATHLLLCGVSTHSCIAQTAMGAFNRNLRVSIARAAVGSEDADLSAALLDHLDRELRERILEQDDALTLLRSRGEHQNQR